MRRFIVVTCALFTFIAGCAETPHRAPTEQPASLPGPSTVQVSGLIKSAHFDVNGHIQAQVRSEAVAPKPLRSRYRGEMTLVLNQGGRTLIDLSTVVEGEYDGSPTGGITQAINRLLDAIAATGPLEQLTPTTRPTTNAGSGVSD